MADRILNVLFLCTGNRARSILAESFLHLDGGGCFRPFRPAVKVALGAELRKIGRTELADLSDRSPA